MHLTRYHGVLAPHSKLRAAVTPAHRGVGGPGQGADSAGEPDKPITPRHLAMSWAQRLKRVFGIEIEACARSEDPTHADAAVLSAVASAFCAAFPRDYLNLKSSTAEPPGSLDDPHGRARLESDVVRSFKERNGSAAMIPADANFVCLRRTDSEKIDEAFRSSPRNSATRPSRTADWTSFYKAFRGSKGVVRMSLPAYSNAGDQATVYLSYSCGRLCGQGSLFVLKRNDDSWLLIKTISLWIS